MTESMYPDKAVSVMDEAASIISGKRNKEHGEIEDSFETIASLWNDYLEGKYNYMMIVTPEDVCIMMALLKIARLCHGQSSRDHYVDSIGYMSLAYQLVENDKEGEDDFTV